MKNYLVTGGSGFFGTVLKHRLLADGHFVTNVDLHIDEDRHSNLRSIQADISQRAAMVDIFESDRFDGVFHVAAMLAHAVKDGKLLWSSNVNGTQIIAELAQKHRIRNLVFTSSNCLWGKPFKRLVSEEDKPAPIEIYGRSKWEGERTLSRYQSELNVVTLRCPTIIGSGRLGLLAILFEFIKEGRRVWTVGSGDNRHQFIYTQDLADAAVRSINHNRSDVFNIGSDNVKSLRSTYLHVIKKANSSSKVTRLPEGVSLFAMRLAHQLKISPLGPYHYKMIAEDFIFDTAKIKRELEWQPTLTNEDMLWRAYQYYSKNRKEIEARTNVSAHKQPAKMGVIRLLKSFS